MTLEEAVFDAFEQQALTYRTTRTATVVALAQALWHHAAIVSTVL